MTKLGSISSLTRNALVLLLGLHGVSGAARAVKPARGERCKPTATVETWDSRTTDHHITPPRDLRNRTPTGTSRQVLRRPDPWEAKLKGYAAGTSVRFEVQERSAPIDPTARSLERATARALRFRTQGTATVQLSDAPSKEFSHLVEENLPTHTPMKISATRASGRRYGDVHLNVEGRDTTSEGTRHDWVYTNIITGGINVNPYDVWTQTENLFVSDKKNGKVRLLGAAAFPAGATVTAFSLDHRLKLKQGWGSVGLEDSSAAAALHKRFGTISTVADETGTADLTVPASWLAHGPLKLAVHFPAVQDKALASIQGVEVQAPAPGAATLLHEGVRFSRSTARAGESVASPSSAGYDKVVLFER